MVHTAVGFVGGWGIFDEAFWVCLESVVESFLSSGVDFGRHQANAGMMVIAIVPAEEVTAKGLGVLKPWGNCG